MNDYPSPHRRAPGSSHESSWAFVQALTRCFPPALACVATCGYIFRVETGIRELRDNLSRYIRRIEAGERIAITAHGRVVAELVPPGGAARTSRGRRWDELIAAGVLHPPIEAGQPFDDWPDIRLPRGTAAALIDIDRGEA